MSQEDIDLTFDNIVAEESLELLAVSDDEGTEIHQGAVVYKHQDYRVIDCKICNFIHVAPIPSEHELSKFYRELFYNQPRKKDYFSKQKSQLGWWNRLFDARLNRIETTLGRKGTILDVGCGPGFFLNRARERGWCVLGIEPADDAVSYARNEMDLPVLNEGVENLAAVAADHQIDVIYSHGVVEHLRQPIRFLAQCRDILNPNGLVFTSAANDFNMFQAAAVRMRGLKPWWIIPPEHINYFSVQSLLSLHTHMGFNVRDVRTSFPIDQFLLMGEDYITHPDKGPIAHKMRTEYETTLSECGFSPLLDKIEAANAGLGMGRQTDIIAELL